jgi:hypothetical protein
MTALLVIALYAAPLELKNYNMPMLLTCRCYAARDCLAAVSTEIG